jgi:tartrate/fumarate subfamily iron-sulfur-dependent hydro-lyase alpha chain
MIPKTLYKSVIFETVHRGATKIPADVKRAFEKAIAVETLASAKEGLEQTLKSIELSAERDNPACPDTGWPIFYFKVGNECTLEGGLMGLEEAARDAVRNATNMGYLRKTMKHPLTGLDPGDNIGMNIPDFTWQFVPGAAIEITYAAKGGGSECFGGTRHRVVAFADGLTGIKKQVIDSYVASARAGAVCPPSILGVGIGGTANLAAALAKKASCLRTIGSAHPDPMIHQIEDELYRAINCLGIGIMGAGGAMSVFAVNVEYAYTHIAGICVATSTNCMVARRATTRIEEDNRVTIMESPDWFGGR